MQIIICFAQYMYIVATSGFLHSSLGSQALPLRINLSTKTQRHSDTILLVITASQGVELEAVGQG